MDAALFSIRPKPCSYIAQGIKEWEFRTRPPKIETPFKGYIYCTKGGYKRLVKDTPQGKIVGSGKVIGEFICDEIIEVSHNGFVNPFAINREVLWKGHLSNSEFLAYTDHYRKDLSALHISQLVIYDKPKELSEFKAILSDKDIRCKYISKPYNPYGKQVTKCTLQKCYCEFHNLAHQTDCEGYVPLKETAIITRPPQSWCRVEPL